MNIIGAIANKITECADKYRIGNYIKHLHKGENVRIGLKTYMSYPKNITIGDNTYINGGMIFASENAKITIGSNCLISYNVHMRTDMHCYKDDKCTILSQGHRENSIILGDDCWIGYGAQIMPGVKIATGTVIGAGAVVTHSTEPYGVYAGVPARQIGKRG